MINGACLNTHSYLTPKMVQTMSGTKFLFLICILSFFSYGLYLLDYKFLAKAQPLEHMSHSD